MSSAAQNFEPLPNKRLRLRALATEFDDVDGNESNHEIQRQLRAHYGDGLSESIRDVR